ncbi:MAG: DUF2269 domain-containing protein [Pseudomonadota bacterium]
MEYELFLRWLHVLGACVLIGTGSGIAFFMLMAHRTREPALIAHTARVVVIADMVFTLSAVIIQPVTGILLAQSIGWSLSEGWIVLSLFLYVLIGLFWLPVVWIQLRLRDLAEAAASAGGPLPAAYDRYFKVWFALGVPAFTAILLIVWLMLARPDLSAWFG